MNKQDLGIYLMVWLISSALFWLLDVEEIFSVKMKVLIPIIITIFVVLLRISIFLMTGE
jgi:hypothetical protein